MHSASCLVSLVLIRASHGIDNRLRGKSQRVEVSADKAPKWNLLMPMGEFHRADFPTADGRIVVDAKYVASMVANWEKGGRPRLPIDYHHRGSSSDTSIRNEDKIAAGWVLELRASDAGLEGLVSWTERARERIQAEELAYFSPEWFHNGPDKHTGKSQGPTFCGGGLLNDPFFLGELPRMAAATEPIPPKSKESTVNKKLLCQRLGLAEDATDEQINAALEALEKLTAAAPDESLKGTVETLKAELAKATTVAAETQKQLADIKAATAAKELAALQDSLLKAGKIKADGKERIAKLVTAMGIDETSKLTADWPVIVEHGERGISGSDAPESNGSSLAKFEALVAEEMAKSKCTSREAMRRVTAAHRDLAIKATAVSTPPAEA